MQPLKVVPFFVYILGLSMVDVVCTFPEVGDQKFMKTRPISGETPQKWGVFSETSGGQLLERCKQRRPESKQQQNTGLCFCQLRYQISG